MRKIAIYVLIVLVIYVIAVCIATWLLPYLCPQLRRLSIIQVAIQFIAAVSTMSAVLWALFGTSVLGLFKRSCLDLVIERSSEHCYLVQDASEIAGEARARLGVFAKVCNLSSVDADACQAVTDAIFASSDGVKFSLVQKVCTTGFTWVYEGKREAVVKRGVDKHFKVVELLERVTAPSLSPDGKITKPSGRTISLSVCIPNFINGNESFSIGSDYKGVMIPVRLVSKTEDVKTFYLKVVWLGSELKDYMVADKLKVMRLSEEDAKKDIV